MTLIYKICTDVEWRIAVAERVYRGAPADLVDGFILFSTAGQLGETLRRHFDGVDGLVIVAFHDDGLGDGLRYEPARGGELFPHLYGTLDPAAALRVWPLQRDDDGNPVLPA